jgi:hypothetical protein
MDLCRTDHKAGDPQGDHDERGHGDEPVERERSRVEEDVLGARGRQGAANPADRAPQGRCPWGGNDVCSLLVGVYHFRGQVPVALGDATRGETSWRGASQLSS